MPSLAQLREAFNRTICSECSGGSSLVTLTGVPQAFATIEVLEVAPADGDLLCRRPAFLARRVAKDVGSEHVKVGC